MSRFINLEEFETADPARPPALSRITPEDLDAQVSASYEQGYSAGFEDAVRQEDEARQHISAELARNLQDLSFTFHEARSHVLRGLEPLLTQLTQAFLPEFAAAALGPLVQSEIVKLAEHATDREFELLIPPDPDSVPRLSNMFWKTRHRCRFRLSRNRVWVRGKPCCGLESWNGRSICKMSSTK